ncbi:MAG: DUF1559 domain-containing protein [Planctomycetota bacterium]|jgi:hypothetical protein
MKTVIRCVLFATLVSTAGGLLAAEGFDPAARAKVIAPYLDESTIAVVHVDVERIEVDPFVDKFLELVPEAAPDADKGRDEMKKARDGFLKAGFRDFYVVIGMLMLPSDSPFVIIPAGDGGNLETLLAAFPPPAKDAAIQRVGDVVFAGSRNTLQRVKTMKPRARPELVDAFKAAGDTTAQLVLLPPPHFGRVVEEMMPTLPKEIGGGPSAILTDGLLWAAVGADSPPDTSLRLVVQSQDNRAAAALHDKWLAANRLISQLEGVDKTLRNFKRAALLMTPKVEGDRLVLSLSEKDGSIRAVLATLTPPIEAARARARRTMSVNNLKQIALAMHSWHDAHKSFPAVGSTDDAGKPLLSWRVHLLPYLEKNALYEQFHLDEPWDSEHNRKLIPKMPAVFRCPSSKLRQKKGLSTYRVVVGEDTVFTGGPGVTFRDIKDGASNTILAVEVDDKHAVEWTRPEGLPFDPENPAKGLGGQFEEGFDAAYCDGSVHFIHETIDPKVLRLLFTRSDGKPIPPH